MAITKPSDLFDFNKWNAELDKLESRKNKYTQSVVQMNDRIQKSYDENIVKLKELGALMNDLGVKGSRGSRGGGVGAVGAEVEKTIAALTRYREHLELVAKGEELNSRTITELRAGLKALETQYNNLDPTTAQFASEQKRIAEQVKYATQVLNLQSQTLKQAKKTVDETNNSYSQLSRQTAELKAKLRDLPNGIDRVSGEINKNNRLAVQWLAQIQKNDKALKAFDASIGNHQRNVGNYSSALNGITGKLGALGLSFSSLITPVLGVATAYEAFAQSIRIIDQFDRLRLGLETVSRSTDDLMIRWKFLTVLADRTGQDIEKLTENYISFAAAAKNTSLEGSKGDAIFKAFSNTFSALGKSSDVANRGLYAIQQMISKTKVNSEELNQQLAEALPGANKIFADALGVSTAKLSEMLKQGKVLSEDVLPKVAVALEKAYGERAARNAETITGSFTRLTNQFKLFIDQLNEDKSISGFFANFNNGLADAFKGYGRLIKQQGIWYSMFAASPGETQRATNEQRILDEFSQDDLPKRIARIRVEQDALGQSLQKLSTIDKSKDGYNFVVTEKQVNSQRKLVKELIAMNTDLRRTERSNNVATRNNPAGPPKTTDDSDAKSKRVLSNFEKLEKQVSSLRNVLVDQALQDLKGGEAFSPTKEALDKWRELYKLLNDVAKATGQTVSKEIVELNDALENLGKKGSNVAVKMLTGVGTKDLTRAPDKNGNISNPVTDKLDQLPGIPALIGQQSKDTDFLNEQLSIGKFKKFLEDDKEALRDQLREIQDLQIQSQLAVTKEEKKAIDERIALADEEFRRKTELAKAHLEERRRIEQAITELVAEAGGAVFQIISDQNQAEIAANQAKMDHELGLVGDNAEAQKKIKEEYTKKDLVLRQKQAKLDKAEAAFKIAISTAVAVASVSPVVPLMIIAAALGAIQLAVVLAKPLPQFFKGTKNAPEGLAQVGERGPEIRESKGKMYYYDKPTVANLSAGDKIYTADETKRMLQVSKNAAEISNIRGSGEISEQIGNDVMKYQVVLMGNNRNQEIDYRRMTGAFVEALATNPVDQLIIDENGFNKFTVMKDRRIKDFNKRYSLS